ncbi:DUF3618 domain-containing protein [Cellulomonas soli]
MSTEPDQIRDDIERTRAELSSDVDALADKVSPSHMAHRQAARARSAVGRVTDRVMGAASTGADEAGAVAGSVGEAARDLPHRAAQSARGNPLAAGLVAFGVGWLVSSLLPSTRPEQELATAAKEQVAPLVEEVKEVAQDAAEHLRAPAQDAAAVKDRAAQAGSTLREEGMDAAQDVRDTR